MFKRTRTTLAVLALLMFLLCDRANASITLNFFPTSDFDTNTTTMDAALGVTGYTIDTFESTSFIPGLTINLTGGVPNTTWTSLPNLFDEGSCGSLTANSAWDGTHEVLNVLNNTVTSCTGPANIAQFITFNYGPGATSLGIGMGNFQSLSSPSFPITNHELFVNGVDMGQLETLAGGAWTAGLARNAYLRIDATGGTSITSVEFENLTGSGSDVLGFDHLAVLPAATTVPEPGTLFVTLAGLLALPAIRFRR